MKQASMEESTLSVFFYLPLYMSRFTSMYQALYNRNIKTQTSYMYIYMYNLLEAHVLIESSRDRYLASYNQPDN